MMADSEVKLPLSIVRVPFPLLPMVTSPDAGRVVEVSMVIVALEPDMETVPSPTSFVPMMRRAALNWPSSISKWPMLFTPLQSNQSVLSFPCSDKNSDWEIIWPLA